MKRYSAPALLTVEQGGLRGRGTSPRPNEAAVSSARTPSPCPPARNSLLSARSSVASAENSPRPSARNSLLSARSSGGSVPASPRPLGFSEIADPHSVGLPGYTRHKDAMPFVDDDTRSSILEATCCLALQQLDALDSGLWVMGPSDFFEEAVQNLCQDINNSDVGLGSLPIEVTKQLRECRLFVSSELEEVESKALFCKLDTLAIPASFEYGASFEEFPSADEVKCWVIHAAAPNIGDNADDFASFSEEKLDAGGRSASKQKSWFGRASSKVVPDPGLSAKTQLDEDLYIDHMYQLWYNALAAMGHLSLTDAVVTPIGMDVFLRNLGEKDARYRDAQTMYDLRCRIANSLLRACQRLITPEIEKESKRSGQEKTGRAFRNVGPKRIHLCLTSQDEESVATHNAFLESTARFTREFRQEKGTYKTFIRVYKNIDPVQLALDLTKTGHNKVQVGILNGTSRRRLGGSWFEDAAPYGTDENLHRRSASLARMAIIFNAKGINSFFSTNDAQPASIAGELASRVHGAGGKVIHIKDGTDVFKSVRAHAFEKTGKRQGDELGENIEGTLRQHVKESFLKADTDGDGVISKDEITGLLGFLGGWSEEQLLQFSNVVFDQIDYNGDGHLSFDEFIDWMMGVEDEEKAEFELSKESKNNVTDSHSGSASTKLEDGDDSTVDGAEVEEYVRHALLDEAAACVQNVWKGRRERRKSEDMFAEMKNCGRSASKQDPMQRKSSKASQRSQPTQRRHSM